MFGVPHPSFLKLGGLDRSDTELGDLRDAQPADAAELRQWVEATLSSRFDGPLVKDDDGDIPIHAGSAMVFVRVVDDAPVVEVFAPLLNGVVCDALVLERLNRANRSIRFVQLTWSMGGVVAVAELFCTPFSPDQLLHLVDVVTELADELDDRLRSEIGGRRFFDEPSTAPTETPDPDALHPALQTMVQLEAGGTELTPQEAARVWRIRPRPRPVTHYGVRGASDQMVPERGSNWRHVQDQGLPGRRTGVASVSRRAPGRTPLDSAALTERQPKPTTRSPKESGARRLRAQVFDQRVKTVLFVDAGDGR